MQGFKKNNWIPIHMDLSIFGFCPDFQYLERIQRVIQWCFVCLFEQAILALVPGLFVKI